MNWLDVALIAWWLLAIATIPSLSWLIHHSRALERRAAMNAQFRGQTPGRYGFAPPQGPGRPISFAYLISTAILVAGLLGFVWISNWTRLLFLNFQIMIFLFGAVLVAGGLSRTFITSPGQPGAMLSRIGCGTFGLLIVAVCAYWIIEDVAFPQLVVEGRVTRMEDYTRLNRGNKYLISINGKQYESTREAYLPLRVGDRVHAELGAGSKIIFSAKRM